MTLYTNIDDLVRGSIDMHVHFAPDAFVPSRMDALDTAKSAHQMGMRAIVLKAHAYPTAPLAAMVGKLVPEVKVFGSLSTNCSWYLTRFVLNTLICHKHEKEANRITELDG